MTTRYVPLKPNERIAQSLGRTRRPSLLRRLFARKRPVLPGYATPDECRRAHPGCEVWSVYVQEGRP
jgi:hypothetical protein